MVVEREKYCRDRFNHQNGRCLFQMVPFDEKNSY
jgi:hypothetical protein